MAWQSITTEGKEREFDRLRGRKGKRPESFVSFPVSREREGGGEGYEKKEKELDSQNTDSREEKN